MSKETLSWLRSNIRIGYTDERGPAWWAASNGEHLADGSHFPGAVPEVEVRRILDVPFVSAKLFGQYEVSEEQAASWEGEYLGLTAGRHVVEDPERKLIVTPDTGDVLGVFKSGYQIHGYQQWTADQIAAILDTSRGELGVAAVGLLRRRGVAFLQAKLEGSGMEVGGYAFAPYITAATSVDGSLASTYATGVQAAVCDNTLSAALSSALTKYRVKHSRNSAGKLGEVRDNLGLVYQAADDFAACAAELQSVDVSEADFRAWMDEMAPVPARDPKSSTGGAKYTNAIKKRYAYTSLWTSDAKVAPWAGTAFGVLQLDNTYRTWTRNVSGADGGRIERNLLNMVSGKTANEDSDALDALSRVLDRRVTVAL
jgi:phage/plasmid-like protein (TIGR03299 family)